MSPRCLPRCRPGLTARRFTKTGRPARWSAALKCRPATPPAVRLIYALFILRFRGLQDVDGFDELPGAPGAAAELTQDVPGLELGVGALAGGVQPCVARSASC